MHQHPNYRISHRSRAARLGRVALLPLALAYFATPSAQGASPRALVVASLPPYAWLAQQIAGDRVHVVALVEPGAGAETYQPTDAQVSQLARADVFLRGGLPFEHSPWFRRLLERSSAQVVDLLAHIDLLAMAEHGEPEHAFHEGGHTAFPDPHVWLSPRRLARQARSVADALTRRWPGDQDHFETNFENLLLRLQQLDVEVGAGLAPLSESAFFVFHPSWGYFADDYHLSQIAIEKSGKNPTDFEVTQILRQLDAQGATVLFLSPEVAGGSARSLAAAVGLRVATLDPLAADVIANLTQVVRQLRAASGLDRGRKGEDR